MVKWSKELYLDEAVRKRQNWWRWRIEHGKIRHGLFCICLASNEKNLFDIINSNELFFRHYRRNVIYITGLAKTRDGAIDLLQDMVEDIYQKTGDVKVREYFTFL